MEKSEALQLIIDVYELDEHRSSDAPNSISATTIIGSSYRANLAITGVAQDESLVSYKLKRGAQIGTAFHKQAERALNGRENIKQELYNEKQIIVDNITYTISGSCDLLVANNDGTYTIMDWKTSFGKKRAASALDKDSLQMSIYRWLFQDQFNIVDKAFTLYISTAYNEEEAYEIHLMSIDETEEYIKSRIENSLLVAYPDCKAGIAYNPCSYCRYICEHRNEI